MNKSEIGWCDFSWNPVTGCKKECDFCYGYRMAVRLCGTVRLNLGSPQIQRDRQKKLCVLERPFHNDNDKVLQFPAGFEPTLHRYRLRMVADKKKACQHLCMQHGGVVWRLDTAGMDFGRV